MPDLSEEQKLQLFDEVVADKGLYRQIVKKLAKDHPETYLPEVELANDIESIKADHRREIDELKAQLQSAKDEQVAAAEIARVKAAAGLDDGGLKAAAEFMEKNGITNMDAAIKFKRLSDAEDARHVPPEDRSSMKLPKDFGPWLKDRRSARRAAIYSGIAEIQEANRRAAILATH